VTKYSRGRGSENIWRRSRIQRCAVRFEEYDGACMWSFFNEDGSGTPSQENKGCMRSLSRPRDDRNHHSAGIPALFY
jgi:hypothetical protein